MWTVTKIRTDYEGWWLFSDWTDHIIEEYHFSNFTDMMMKYSCMIHQCRCAFDNYRVGKYNIHAFYNSCDLNFCEDCDEDMQIFYSIIVLNNNEVYYKLPIIE